MTGNGPHHENQLGTLPQQVDKGVLLSTERRSMNRSMAGEFLKRLWSLKDELRRSYERLNTLEADMLKAFGDNTFPKYDATKTDNASRIP